MKSVLSDQLEIWGFEGDTIIFADGTFGFGLELSSVDVSTWSSERANEFTQGVRQFLNGLADNVDLQFVQDIEGGNEKWLEQHAQKRNDAANAIVSSLAEERVARLKELDERGEVKKLSLRLIVRRPPLRKMVEKKSLSLFSDKTFEAITEERLQTEIIQTNRLRDDIAEGLAQLGIGSKQIDADRVAELMYLQWNPARKVRFNGFDPDNVRDSVLFSDVSISERGFSISGVHYRVVSLKLLPDNTFATMIAALQELPFGSRLMLTVRSPNQQKEIESLQAQRRMAYSLIAGKRSGVSDLDTEAKFRDLEELLEQMVAAGEKVFHVSLQVILKSESEDELADLVSQTLMKIRELSGAEGMEESLAAFDIFSETALPNARSKERAKRMKTSSLADLLPLYGPWRGHAEPKVILGSRFGSLVSFDPFSPTLTNSNQIVSGGSGSGKSFLTNLLLVQMMKEDPKVFIVDIGGSYKKICENLGGQYLPLGVDSNFSINPFDLATGDVGPSNQKVKFLLSLVEIMSKEEGEVRLGKFERAEIENAIKQVYDTTSKPKLSDLRKALLRHESDEIRKIGAILGLWCGDSPFGRFIDQETTVKLESSLVCFDLKGLDSLPDLQAAVLFIITDFVWRQVQVNRGQPKFLIFDECWKLLENEAGALFIAEVFRTFRKYMASAIAISQNIDDFAKNKVSGAILSNTSIRWILRQKGADQSRLKEVLSLNDNELALLASLRQEKGFYSEAFLIAEDQRSVVVVESTPLEYWLATTDPRDLAEFEKARDERPQGSDLELLRELSIRFPQGVSQGETNR